MKPVKRWIEWLLSWGRPSQDRRIAERLKPPNLVAHYWDGAAPLAHEIRDISSTGLYMVTEQRWYPGTVVLLALQTPGVPDGDPDRSITVSARVVRQGADGVALAFALPEKKEAIPEARRVVLGGADRETFRKFLERVFSRDRRIARRQKPSNLVAHSGEGAALLAHDIRDISSTGLYLLTEQRWDPGTVVLLSLQAPSAPAGDPDHSITVQAKVVRIDEDGVGFVFVPLETQNSGQSEGSRSKPADKKTLSEFLQRLIQEDQGHARLEHRLLLPLLLLPIVHGATLGAFLTFLFLLMLSGMVEIGQAHPVWSMEALAGLRDTAK